MDDLHYVRGWPRGRTHIVPAGQWRRHSISTAACGRRFSAYESDRIANPGVLAGVTVTDRKPSCRPCLARLGAASRG